MIVRAGIVVTLVLLGLFSVVYWTYAAGAPIGAVESVSYYSGALAALCMSVAMLLAARPRRVEGAFGGLDRMYRLHKYLGVASLALVLAHLATGMGGDDDDAAALAAPVAAESEVVDTGAGPDESEDDLDGLIGPLGMLSAIGFILLIVATLNRKIPYHKRIVTHKFMGLFFALVTGYISVVLLEGSRIPLASAPGLMLATLVPSALVAYLYTQLIRPRWRARPFTLEAVHTVGRTTELVLRPDESMFEFTPGQFAFVEIGAPGLTEVHPFSISSGVREGRLRFTVKALGDYTPRLRDHVHLLGARVRVEGPYGRFNPLGGLDRQVWIAGGIGITPFLSVMRTLDPEHGKTIHLYYCVREGKEAVFWDELTQRAILGGVSLHRIETETGARLGIERLVADLGDDLTRWEYYLCGPRPLTSAISKGLRRREVPARQIHDEPFELR